MLLKLGVFFIAIGIAKIIYCLIRGTMNNNREENKGEKVGKTGKS